MDAIGFEPMFFYCYNSQSPEDSLHASIFFFAGHTGVEPAPSAVTGRHLNRLTYTLNFEAAEKVQANN